MSQRLWRILSILILALWLGGIVWLMAGVQAMFNADRQVAVRAAPILFVTFDRYQLILAPLALLAALLHWRSLRSRAAAFLAILATVALMFALTSSLVITPRIDALRLAGQGGSAQFKSLHALSMLCLTVEAGLLALWLLVVSAFADRR